MNDDQQQQILEQEDEINWDDYLDDEEAETDDES